MLNNELLLLSGNDILFTGGHIMFHVPTIKEIGYIGEEEFHVGVRFLNFNKDLLVTEDKSDLDDKSNFNIFMSVMNSKQNAKHKTDALKVLNLIFPNVKIKIKQDKILLQQENVAVESSINELNFDEFQDIIRQVFCLDTVEGGKDYKPADALAKKIAEKFKKGRQKVAQQKEEQNPDIFLRYVSILSVGLQKDMNDLLNYTVYQLFDEMKRYQMKQDFDIYIQAKMAGAKDLEEVKNWMESIHS